jgi:hypothetical protein
MTETRVATACRLPKITRQSRKNVRPIRLVLTGAMAGIVVSMLVTGVLPVAASMGAGLDLAEIKVDEALRPGEVYQLPTVGVLNTGDRAGSYKATIAAGSDQTEPVPCADWFQLEPRSFDLEAGASTRVAVSMHLPVDAQQGDYFVLIEVRQVTEGGGDAIGAATRLHFSVKKSDRGFFHRAAPYLCAGAGLVAAVALIWLFRRFSPFRLTLERR